MRQTGMRPTSTRPSTANHERERARLPRQLVVALTVALLAVVGSLSYTVLVGSANSRAFLVRHVQVEGNVSLSEHEVLVMLGLDRPRNALSLDVEQMRRALQASRWVRHADVQVSRRGRVWVQLEEVTPAAVVAAGRLYLVSDAGEPIERVERVPDTLPLWVGMTRTDEGGALALDGVVLRYAARVHAAWQASGFGSLDALDELHFADVSGFTVVSRAGVEVALGHEDPVSQLATLDLLEGQLAGVGAQLERVEFLSPSELRLFFVDGSSTTTAAHGVSP